MRTKPHMSKAVDGSASDLSRHQELTAPLKRRRRRHSTSCYFVRWMCPPTRPPRLHLIASGWWLPAPSQAQPEPTRPAITLLFCPPSCPVCCPGRSRRSIRSARPVYQLLSAADGGELSYISRFGTWYPPGSQPSFFDTPALLYAQ